MTALLAVGGGIAWATIPAADGTIRACYDSAGILRVIDEGKSCAKGLKGPISWNQQGVPGQDGVSGVHIVKETIPVVEGKGRTQGVVECPEGEIALGGGVSAPAIDHWALTVSTPLGVDVFAETPTSWLGVAEATDGSVASATDAQLRSMALRVVCAVVP